VQTLLACNHASLSCIQLIKPLHSPSEFEILAKSFFKSDGDKQASAVSSVRTLTQGEGCSAESYHRVGGIEVAVLFYYGDFEVMETRANQ
jgi:hypothetical protein